MRVDNKIVMYDYCGTMLFSMPFDELLGVAWRPRARGAFPDRPPSPEREARAAGKGGAKGGYSAEPKKQAYQPPGSRGSGGAYRPPGASGGGGGLGSTLRLRRHFIQKPLVVHVVQIVHVVHVVEYLFFSQIVRAPHHQQNALYMTRALAVRRLLLGV